MSVNRDMIKHLTIVAEQIGTNLKQFERKFDNLGGTYCSYADLNRCQMQIKDLSLRVTKVDEWKDVLNRNMVQIMDH